MTAPAPPPASLARLQRAARLLDSRFRIPVIGVRFGLDPILGLIPGLGDAVAFGLGAWIIAEAARMGAPRALLGRMLANSAVVVPGARAVTVGAGREWGLSLSTPVIVKYRDDRTDTRTELEQWIR